MKKVNLLFLYNFILLCLFSNLLSANDHSKFYINKPDLTDQNGTIIQPEDCISVRDIHKNKTELNNTTVKFYARVLNIKNRQETNTVWFRLSDTYDTSFNSNSIIVNSHEKVLPEIGEIICVEGMLKTDVDRSQGYFFPVLIENATIYQDRNN